MSKPRGPFESARAWVEADAAWQQATFDATGKRPLKLVAPPRDWFSSDEENAAALAGRLVLCDKECHVGPRMLTNDQTYAGKQCKSCKTATQKEKRTTARADALVVFDTAEAFMDAHAHKTCETHPSIQGSCRAPTREELATQLEYDRAVALRDQWMREYMVQYNALHRERNNQTARERYEKKRKNKDHTITSRHSSPGNTSGSSGSPYSNS